MGVLIEFTEDYATRKKGEKIEVDSLLASDLVRSEKVAKYVKTKK